MNQNENVPRLVLSGLSPQIDGLRWESHQALRIGRQNNLEIVLHEASISRQHAEIFFSPRGWMVRDMGSSNGTFLNGVQVEQTPRKIQQQDVLHCGNLGFQVALLVEEAASTPMQTPAKAAKENIKTTGFLARIQAATRRSWEQGLEDLASDSSQLKQGKHFLHLLRSGYHLCRIGSLGELLQSILDDTVAVFDANHGAVVLQDETGAQLNLKAVSGLKDPNLSANAFSTTLVQRCFAKGESLLVADVGGSKDLQGTPGVREEQMTSIICAILRSPRKRLGVLHLDRGPFQEPFTKEDLHLADALAAGVSVGIECAQLVEKQREPFLDKITTFVRGAMELRDPHTGQHTQGVQKYARLLGEEVQLSAAELQQLETGALLHDLGKIGIDDAVLRKPGKLTAAEYAQMKEQTLKGAALAEIIADFAPLVPVIRSHHEHWDGTGYPDGLRGETIPRLARIVAIANAFDTMTADQPYRPALSLDEAFAELRAGAGSQFDPSLVDAFLRLRPRLEDFFLHQAHNLPEPLPVSG